jgi:hypothetical protein
MILPEEDIILAETTVARKQDYEISVSSISSDGAIVWFTSDENTDTVSMSVGQTEVFGRYSLTLVATKINESNSSSDNPKPGDSVVTATIHISV